MEKAFFSAFLQKKFAGKEKVVIFAARFDGNDSYLTILEDKYKQVPRKIRESRALISLKEASGQTRVIRIYTKKSLILAQDER